MIVLAFLMPYALLAQNNQQTVVDYSAPKKYVLKGIKVEGTSYLNADRIVALTGLQKGDEVEIPSDMLSGVMKRIWMQRKFSDVGFYIDSLSPKGDSCLLVLKLQERPRVSRWLFDGAKNSEKSDLTERLKLRRGGELSDYVEKSSIDIIKNYYKEKGFYKVDVHMTQQEDTVIKNAVIATFHIKKGDKIKIDQINFHGVNDEIKESKLAKAMKKTKDRRITNFFRSKKFNEKEYKNDKNALIEVFNEAGFRDALVVSDSISYTPDNRMVLDIFFDQGKKYYFRNITWTGNSVYSTEQLNSVLMIKKGDIYDVVTMDKRLQGDPKQQYMDVRKMYTDNGYLFFNVMPVELAIDGDSVDVEMRIMEGKPATFNNVVINGNTITSEKVARRAVYTRPGYLYSQSEFERSIRELGSIGHFDPEKFQSSAGYSIIPNPNNNTVDIAYNVEAHSVVSGVCYPLVADDDLITCSVKAQLARIGLVFFCMRRADIYTLYAEALRDSGRGIKDRGFHIPTVSPDYPRIRTHSSKSAQKLGKVRQKSRLSLLVVHVIEHLKRYKIEIAFKIVL